MARKPSAILRARTTAFAVSALLSSPVFAHGDHGGGGGTVLPAGITLVTADVDYAKYQPISDARLTDLAVQGVDGVHSLKSIAVPSVSIAYGVTSDLTVGVRLPYLANSSIRETDTAAGSITPRGGVYGIGDTTVTATYRFLREGSAGFAAAAIVGVKAPTGRSDAQNKFGVLFETEHQPSSGSWDVVFGFNVSKQVDTVGLSASVRYGLAGDGGQNTNLGDHFSYGVAISYRLGAGSSGHGGQMHLGADRPAGIMYHGGHDHAGDRTGASPFGPMAVDLTLGLNADWHDQQGINHIRDSNTGGTVVYLSPGLRLSTERTTASVTFGIPILTHLDGYQSEPDWRLASSFGVRF